MDNHPSCRRLHKIPAHTFKDPGKWPQRRSRVLRSFLRSEPPIIAGFSASSTPFSRPSHRSGRCCRSCFVVGPERLSSLRAAYYGRPFSFVNNLFEELEALREVVAASPGQNQVPAKKGKPRCVSSGVLGINPGDDLLSHGLSHTTIGAAAFHFRVRDGIGWFHSANFTREAFGESHSSRGTRRQPRIVLVT